MNDNDLKVAVLFFSATGNCERIAKNIAFYFENKASLNASLIDITQKFEEALVLPVCDILFLVTPVYSQLCPAFIKKFLKNLQFKGNVVPCVSYGSISAGIALKQICGILQKNGANILAGAEFASFHFYLDSCDTNAPALKESETVNKLCLKAVSRLNEKIYLKTVPVQHFNLFSLFMPRLRTKMGVKLKCLDKDICAKCKKCKDNCPFGAINKDLKVSGKCQRCGACVKACKNSNKQLLLRPIVRKYLEKYINYSRDNNIY